MLPVHHPAINDLRIDAAEGRVREGGKKRGRWGVGGGAIGIVSNTHLHKSSILLS